MKHNYISDNLQLEKKLMLLGNSMSSTYALININQVKTTHFKYYFNTSAIT